MRCGLCSVSSASANYLKGDDLPPGILQEDEKESLSGDCPETKDGPNGTRLYNAAETWLCNRDRYAAEWWDQKLDWCASEGRLSPDERDELYDLAKLDYSWDETPETEWILCNWTLAQYVRVSAVAELTGTDCDGGPWTTTFLSLGHVLLTQICWSSDPSVSMRYKGPFHRGRWAGHYFAITAVDQLTEDRSFAEKKDWTDVTDKIVGEVLEIWRADHPEGLAPHLRPKGRIRQHS
ncbi:uncharacterized protein B0H18DRAFT_994778 [Fomitopsis serialis]|uniref:uncharacterized protein n=1 Tax=Fomitopsis serialis TaxID=139415 RepID=UPI0020077F1D|nr:uncharacterized protein B0H18DRAFT_994778 [Neoantrodia serialis]KAH9930005.1 hypothetical protein B0H18DRAFT_994778 [Neoantrodia serialis]